MALVTVSVCITDTSLTCSLSSLSTRADTPCDQRLVHLVTAVLQHLEGCQARTDAPGTFASMNEGEERNLASVLNP